MKKIGNVRKRIKVDQVSVEKHKFQIVFICIILEFLSSRRYKKILFSKRFSAANISAR